MAGVKGKSGRKSIREEVKEFINAQNIFFDEHDQEEIERKIQSGRFSIKDRLILNAMEGDTATVLKAYQKAVPDMVDHTTNGKDLPTPITHVLRDDSHEEDKGTQEEN